MYPYDNHDRQPPPRHPIPPLQQPHYNVQMPPQYWPNGQVHYQYYPQGTPTYQYPHFPPYMQYAQPPMQTGYMQQATHTPAPINTQAETSYNKQPQRERKRLTIVNPTTNEAVRLDAPDTTRVPPIGAESVTVQEDSSLSETSTESKPPVHKSPVPLPVASKGDLMLREVHKRALSDDPGTIEALDKITINCDEIPAEEYKSDEEEDYEFHIEPHESAATATQRKLQYDREFLLKFSQTKMSLKKPTMPDGVSEIVHDEPHKDHPYSPVDVSNDFTPDFMSFNRSSSYSGKNNHRNSPSHRRSKHPPASPGIKQKVIDAPMRKKEELKRSDNAYVPDFLNKKAPAAVNGDIDVEALGRKFRSILNRVTPQNFSECMDQLMIELKIVDEDALKCLIENIFVKAVKEEAYSVTFAQMCASLMTKLHSPKFKSLLLSKCQTMFETPLKNQLDVVCSDWDQKVKDEKNESTKKLLMDDKDEQIKKAKDKYYGNIRFIGELFLHNMLRQSIIERCIKQLLQAKETESLECLCKLLETTGGRLETLSNSDTMNDFFNQIDQLILSKSVESRMRYKLMDLKDMRSRKWVLRKIQEQRKIRPMTKDELEKDEIKIQDEKNQAIEAANKNRKQGTGRQSNVMPPPSRPPPQRSVPLDASKLTLTPSDANSVTLGPGSSLSKWAKGSGNKEKKKPADDWITKTSSNSRNAPKVSRETSRSRDASPRPSLPTPPKQPLYPSPAASSPVVGQEPELTDADQTVIQVKSEHILTEFISTENFDKEVFEKISNNSCYFVRCLVNYMIEKDKLTREKTGKLFHYVLKEKLMDFSELIKGFSMVFEEVDDIVIDCPNLWQFLAECIHMLITEDLPDLSYMTDLLSPLVSSSQAAPLLSKILHLASNQLGHTLVGKMFTNSSLDWGMFLQPSDNIGNFVEKHDLRFTLAASSSPQTDSSPVKTGISLAELESKLASLVVDPKVINETIFEVLERDVDLPTSQSINYLNLVCRLIFEGVTDFSKNYIDANLIEERSPIIKRIINHREDWEVHVIYTIQSLALHIKPQDLVAFMQDLFELILTNQIVSQDAISTWRNSKPEVTEGYEITKTALATYFALFDN